MCCETMTSPERLGAVIEGQKPDPVRVIPFISGHSALVCGQPISRFNEDAEPCFRCQVLGQDVYRYGGVPFYVCASVPQRLVGAYVRLRGSASGAAGQPVPAGEGCA